MTTSTQPCPSGFIHTSSSSESLSSPTYSLRENREGELVSLTQEMVHWPQRPASGKYSEAEEKKSRQRARRAASKKPSMVVTQSVASDIVGPASQPITVDSAVLRNSVENLLEWAMKRSTANASATTTSLLSMGLRDSSIGITPQKAELTSSSILGPEARESEPILLNTEMLTNSYDDLLSLASSRSFSDEKDSVEAVDGNTFAILGKCSPDEALKKLGPHWTAVLFEDGGKLQLALAYDRTKYMLPLAEVQTSQGPSYGISKKGSKPDVSFYKLEQLAHFYSLYPLMAFF